MCSQPDRALISFVLVCSSTFTGREIASVIWPGLGMVLPGGVSQAVSHSHLEVQCAQDSLVFGSEVSR